MVRSKVKGKTTIEDRKLTRTPITIVTSMLPDLSRKECKSQLTLKSQQSFPKNRGKLNQARMNLRRI
jgi:hypothetical protein